MRLVKRFQVIAALAAVMVGVQLVNMLTANSLLYHGIIPRTTYGLQGIVFAPFLHGSVGHLVSNLPAFVVLSWLVSSEGLGRYVRVFILIAGLGGFLVWLVGRPSIHVGASGLIFGLWTYVLTRAWFQRSLLSLLIAAIALAAYGGLIFGFLPVPGVSFESHIMGAIAGMLASWLMHSRRLVSGSA
ncbi:rhomboid family intramembrane serine protease [Pseudomonas duriflava]|uniref:rhomboid family intramembrane serine protease n=1 Tax=Pseudomonas duriflava TaxID=459528 RepID=UPI0011A537D8|nr:rhomboid family intramembrane serine protease [Pseudomonas duriflava]